MIMKHSVNPVHDYGEKNIFCPHYSACLDHAVLKSWDSFMCDECVYRLTKERLKNVQILRHDDSPYYTLGTL